jgi:hypothetical protein
MADRSVIEWDKDDIDALGLMKVDVLALGMLSAIRRCFDLVKPLRGGLTWPPSRGLHPTYDMICRPTPWACSRSRAARRCPCCRGCGRAPTTTW